MARQYKVAFLGIDKPEDDGGDLVGLKIYNSLSLDKVIDIIQNHGPKGYLNDKAFDINPEQKCLVLCSGREPAFTSRMEVLNLVEGIDILIISACTELVFARTFLSWLTPDVLPKSCVLVVRHPYQGEEHPYLPYHASWWLEDMNLTVQGRRRRGQRGLSKYTGKIQRKIFILGSNEYGGESLEKSLPLLEDHLIRMKPNELTKPVKETASAGRSLMNSLTNWMFGKT